MGMANRIEGRNTLRSVLRIGVICIGVASCVAGCASRQADIWRSELPSEPAGIEATVIGRPGALSRAVNDAALQIDMRVVAREPQVTFDGVDYSLAGADGVKGRLRVWFGKRQMLKDGMTIRVNHGMDWAVTPSEMPIHIRIGSSGDAARESAFVEALQTELQAQGDAESRTSHSGGLAPRAGP